MISSDRLAVLLAAANAGSFAAAAKTLFLTPSAVSQQVAALERDVGVKLFERSRSGVRLTVAGQILRRHAEVVLNRLADARAEVDSLVSGETGRVVLGSFPTATAGFAAAAVAVFRLQHPHVEVRLVDGEPADSVRRLTNRELDLAVVFDLPSWPAYRTYEGRDVAGPTDIEYLDLCADPFLVMLPREHPLAAKPALAIVDLRGERITGSSNGCAPWGEDLRRLCAEAGFEAWLEPLYTSDDFQAQQALVAAGLGLSLLPALAAISARDDICLRPLQTGPVRRVRVAFRAEAFRSAAATALVAVLDSLAGPAVQLAL